MILGFTGTQKPLPSEQADGLRQFMMSLPNVKAFHHGDCIGADAAAAQFARELGIWVVGHPPSDAKKRAFFPSDEEWEPKPYLERNRDIVDVLSDEDMLIATPRGPEELRSGTWSTVRYARKTLKPISMVLPNGLYLKEW